MNKAYKLANLAKPTERQLKWQETEFYALISYGMPVFTRTQYGSGFTPAAVFWPEDMDTDSWCETAKQAGMKGIVLTCKHYDGFCLWPSAYTDYSVKSSNWLDGEGDLVKMVSDSCKKFGLKFGISLAPWDKHEESYGKGKAYDDYFCDLLSELLSNYGEIFTVWLDGIIGADENKKQDFDWGRYYKLIRSLQPDAAIAFMGPDVRWSGNEKGVTRPEEWSPVPKRLGISEDGVSIPKNNKKDTDIMSPDIGSRKAIKNDGEFIWYPCEVAVPMRKNWFFAEDDKYGIKTKDKLLKLYYNTVGNNANLMLGLSPNKRGVIDDVDRQILFALGHDLETFFGADIVASSGGISVSSYTGDNVGENVKNANKTSFWRPSDSDNLPEITIDFGKEEYFDKIVIQENIANGQHVEGFIVYFLNEKNKWRPLYVGSTIGYKRICDLRPVKTSKVKFVFKEFRDFFEISKIQIN